MMSTTIYVAIYATSEFLVTTLFGTLSKRPIKIEANPYGFPENILCQEGLYDLDKGLSLL